MKDRTPPGQTEPSAGLSLGDVYYVLFRRKWMILILSAAGLLGALAVCLIKPPRYRSQAQLFIRYVVEGRALSPTGDDVNMRPLNAQESSVLDTEAQILRSLDVARDVVTNIGAAKILGRSAGPADLEEAAGVVLKNIEVELSGKGSVITVFYQNTDPEVAREVLGQVIVAYTRKHKEMHRPPGAVDDLNQQVEQIGAELVQTDRKLREAKVKAGITSLDEARKVSSRQLVQKREEIFNVEADLAEREAMLKEVLRLGPETSLNTNQEHQIPADQLRDYGRVTARLELMNRQMEELLLKFTQESLPVTTLRQQISEAETQRKRLEDKTPGLAAVAAMSPRQTGSGAAPSLDPATAIIQVSAFKAKQKVLLSQLNQLQTEAAKLDEMEGTIQTLQRQKDLQEADLKYYMDRLGQSRIDEAIGAGKAPNISIIQSPSPPIKEWNKTFKKKVGMLAAGGIAAGLALAFLLELILDRSVKRPGEVLTKLRLPLFISMPRIGSNGGRRPRNGPAPTPLLLTGGDTGPVKPGATSAALQRIAPTGEGPLQHFFDGLRDRVIVHLEAQGGGKKPKLVAVTSCSHGAGVTTIANGLAASLSETGDGNVLLVDMNSEQGKLQRFRRGQPADGLGDAAAAGVGPLIHPGLQITRDLAAEEKLPGSLPGRFASLIPKLKAGDYDYIVFDMPAVSQTSMTPRASRVMDLVLLVLESEKTSQDVVKQATLLLGESKVPVSAVLNKTRTYVPTWLHQDFLNES